MQECLGQGKKERVTSPSAHRSAGEENGEEIFLKLTFWVASQQKVLPVWHEPVTVKRLQTVADTRVAPDGSLQQETFIECQQSPLEKPVKRTSTFWLLPHLVTGDGLGFGGLGLATASGAALGAATAPMARVMAVMM